MKLPYLQVSAETWPKAKELAAVLDIPMGIAFMMLCDLWSWGLTLGPPDEAPTGEFTGSYAVARLAGAVNWTGDRTLLKEALVQLDLVAFTDEGLRVRGLDRYSEAWAKAKRSRDRVAKWRDGSQPEAPVTRTERVRNADVTRTERVQNAYVHPETQTQTQTQINETPPGEFRDRIDATFQKERGANYAWTFDDERAVEPLLRKSDGSQEEIHRRWAVALRKTTFPQCNSVVDLNRHWNAYAKDRATGPPSKPKDIAKGTVTAESQAGLHSGGLPF